MRFPKALLMAGILVLGLGIHAQAADYVTQKAGNVSIDLPKGWEVAPKDFMAKLASSNPNILLLAQGPDNGFPKLTVVKSPDPATQAQFKALDAAQLDALCKGFNANIAARFGDKLKATCEKVKGGSAAALSTRMTLPAEGKTPELTNINWSYPNGGNGVAVSVMFPSKDNAKYTGEVMKTLGSVKFAK